MKNRLASALSVSFLVGVSLGSAGCTPHPGAPAVPDVLHPSALPPQKQEREPFPAPEAGAAAPASAQAAFAVSVTEAIPAGADPAAASIAPGDEPQKTQPEPSAQASAYSPVIRETPSEEAGAAPAATAVHEQPTVTGFVYAGTSTAAGAAAVSRQETVSIPVLNYHSIGQAPGNTLVLAPETFALQMSYLAEHGFTPLSLTEFILILEKKKHAPPKPVLLTFDDGYADNFELAMPVLRKHQFPATLFMSPGAVGQAGYLDWEQVKQMHEAGWDIQPHGMTHPHLPKLSAGKQKEEILEAKRLIEEKLGTKADVFCYPYGEFNKTTLSVLKEAGFRYAFTIRQGWATSEQPPLELRRIYVNGKDRLTDWIGKLSKP